MKASFLRRDSADARRGRNRAAYKAVRSRGYSKEQARKIAGEVRPRRRK